MQVALAQNITIATYQYANNTRIDNISPLAKHLTTLGITTQVKSYPTVQALIEAIQHDEVDIALINTFGYMLLTQSTHRNPTQPCAVLTVPPQVANNYTTAFVTRYNNNIATIEALTKQAGSLRLALVAAGSTSGNLMPRLKLAGVGITNPEVQFQHFQYGGNHTTTLQLLLQHKADVVAIGSTTYFDMIKDAAIDAQLKLLWLSPEIPLGPVLLHQRLPKTLQQQIQQSLLALHETNPAALASVKAGWTEAYQATKYIAIDTTYYQKLYQQLGDPALLQPILQQFAP